MKVMKKSNIIVKKKIGEKMQKKKNGNVMITIALVLIPILTVFLIIGFHSNVLLLKSIHYGVFILLFLTIIILGVGIFLWQKTRKEKKEKQPKWKVISILLLFFLEYMGATSFLILLYGPWKGFRDWLIPTAMTTMSHQYFATWFYSREEIQSVLESNSIIEVNEETDLNLIEVGKIDFSSTAYANQYDKEILTKENEDDVYKIIPINEKKYKGYLVAIYNPEKVGVATTKYLNIRGQYVTEMASSNNALVAINGGGFIDPNYTSNGGTPHGVVIKNGTVISDKTYDSTGGLIGFTKDNKMILGKMSASAALQKGVRDAVTFGPFLIVNGKKSFIKGNGGWGSAPRTAIGQRKDGIVLFLVIDGRKLGLPGADMVDLTEIMSQYGAYNAANLDGGTSSVLVLPESKAKSYLNESEMKRNCREKYCYINDPIDGGGDHATRWIASSFIVK